MVGAVGKTLTYQATLVEAHDFTSKIATLFGIPGRLRMSKPNYFNPKDRTAGRLGI